MQNSKPIAFFTHYHFWFFALVFLVLNLFKLDVSSVYLDEAYSLYYSQQDWSGMSSIFEREANPPLYFIVLYGWVHAFGANVVTGRLLSLICSITLLIVIGRWTNRKISTFASVLFCVLFISNPFVINMSMEVRSFTLSALIIGGSLIAFFRLRERNNFKSQLLFTSLCILALYTHLNTVFPVGMLSILLLFSPVKNKIKWAHYSIIAVASLPILLILSNDKLSSTSLWLERPGWYALKEELMTLFGSITILILALCSLVVLFFLTRIKEYPTRYYSMALITITAGSIFSGFMVSQSIPIFKAKYLFYALPLLLLVVAVTFNFFLKAQSLRIKALVVLAFLATFTSSMFFQPHKSENWKNAVQYAMKLQKPNSYIFVSPVYMYRPFGYYFDQSLFNESDDLTKSLYDKKAVFINQISDELFNFVNPDNIIYLTSHQEVIDPKWENVRALNDRYTYLSDTTFAGIQVFNFEKYP